MQCTCWLGKIVQDYGVLIFFIDSSFRPNLIHFILAFCVIVKNVLIKSREIINKSAENEREYLQN